MLFDQVAEVTRSMVPDDLGVLHLRARRWALKAWFGPAEPVKEHYEAQLLGDACLTRIQRAADWRAELGPEAEVGGFIGRPDQWRRVSEIWVDPDLSDDGIAWEIAARLTDYIVAIEPHR